VTGHVRIESIADHLETIETIARWHWEAWGHADPEGSLATWTAGLRQRTNRATIPTTYVALAGDDLPGSVTLVRHDMTTRRELSPWLAGLYVVPSFRGRSVGSALVRHAVSQAATLGAPRLYLHTATAQGLYSRLGWRPIATEWYEGESATVMAIDTAHPPTSDSRPATYG
jgi:GNAT superfamily N-acetyltransferase